MGISLNSSTLTTDQLRETLAGWVAEYESRINSDKHLKYFVYTPNNDATDDYYDATSHYQEFKFESGKAFSNVFYPEKEDVVKRLDFFTKNKAWYKKRGIPYTMGFMFYGDPGCGKTSTIKAIANHTQRHIVSVPLNKIKTVKELLNVFYNTRMNYVDIPLDKRLYVLEDIDAADLKDTVGERSDKDTENKEDSEKEEGKDSGRESPMDLFGLLKNSPMGPSWDKKFGLQKLTLANLLEVLDGGIDMKGHFSRMRGEDILDMFRHYFELDPPASVRVEDLPDLKWSPAEVTQVFLNNMHDPEAALNQLITSDSLENIHLKPREE